METYSTETIERSNKLDSFAGTDRDDQSTQERLDLLISANREYAHREEIFSSDKEKLEADLMKNPLTNEQAFAYFGFLLGLFPPAAIFAKIFIESDGLQNSEDFWIIFLLMLVNTTSAIVGFYSGKIIGKLVLALENQTWHKMILTLPFLGFLWGIISGGIGGVFLFIVGAVFGGMIGGAVGAVALPVFTVFHRILKCGDKIESKLFIPLALGITLIISTLILGY